MKKQEERFYKCILRPTLWWTGNESAAKHYLVQKKDKSFRVVGTSGIKHDMKYRFTDDDIEMIRAKHPEFDMLFRVKETRVYAYSASRGRE